VVGDDLAGDGWGTLTLLFTDIQGSTRMLDRLGERYRDLLAQHHRLMREAIDGAGGQEVDTAGDSFFAVFARAGDAVHCAQLAQRALAECDWPGGEEPRVRMGIHTGAPEVRDGGFVGLDVHRAARVMAVACGGQVLLTGEARDALGALVEVRDLGYHRLKDLPAPEHLFQLLAAGLESEFPRLRSLNRSNLPAPASPLIDRQEEVARAMGLLSGPEVRLVTLLGTGGAGKTRLALEVAAEAVSRYGDGAWILPLAPIPDAALMVSELARVLEVKPVAGQPLRETVIAALSERELLLVLDNFEHLLDSAGLVADVLASAPRVDVLSTSREPLRIRGEQRMDVPPLALDHACELFLARALEVRPELSVEDEDRVAVERLCARLDGLPLALELAAARIAVFGPRVLEARLAERLGLPEGPRDLPERQRTLRSTIDWSYRLLEPAEQTRFRALAPFIGGVRIDSAESIWGPDASEGLISLAEKSLLRRREDADGEPRFWMLETVREFAREQAAATETNAGASETHAQYFFALAEDAAPQLVGREQHAWLDRLERDHANLRVALEHLTEHAPAKAVRMAGNLSQFWDIRGYAPEARRRLDHALAAALTDSPGRAQALFWSGRMELQLGRETAEVEPLLMEALSLAREHGEERIAIVATSHLGWIAGASGDSERATARHEQAVAAARTAGDDWALGVALNNYAEAFTRIDCRRARELTEEALRIRRRIGEPRAIAITAGNLAVIALDAGDMDSADSINHEALRASREIDYKAMIASALGTRAIISLLRDDIQAADAQFREAVETAREAHHVLAAATLLSVAGTVAAIRHEPIAAATLWSASERLQSQGLSEETLAAGELRARWQPVTRTAAPDQTTWDAACKTGAELSLDHALDLALRATGSIQTSPSDTGIQPSESATSPKATP
jgi:predicted ATPase/class 3 adenylate cyclase